MWPGFLKSLADLVDSLRGALSVLSLSPLDATLLTAPNARDLVALSTSRGTGGRCASGFRLIDAGDLTFTTGAGKVETWASLPAGFALTVELASITFAGKVVVTW
jgi:hypothetical protein